MGNTWSIAYPPKPTFTEKNVSDQTGKVFIVTGASSGVGEQLAAILYQHNAKIYLAARSEEKAQQAIQRIKTAVPSSKGDLIFLHLDLGDLTTVKKSADDFLTKEEKLDVLWNNAGVMVPPEGSKTTQGLDLEYGTNNVGPFLFTHFLHPVLAKTARVAPPNSVRVIWVSSSLAAFCAPKPAIDFDNMDYKKKEPKQQKYGRSKAGNILHSLEFSGRYKDEGILSLSLNPGNLKTDLQRHLPSLMNKYLVQPMLHHPRFGAYTELYAGLSLEITEKQNGAWVNPWGRLGSARKDFYDPDLGTRFWEWTEEQVAPYK